MYADWESYLIDQGAGLSGNQVTDFGNLAAEAAAYSRQNIFTPLTYFNVLEISGNDCRDFLHAQLTTRVDQLLNHHMQFSAWCDARGKVIANFYICLIDQTYYLLLPVDITDSFIKRLQMYVLRADVTIINQYENLAVTGICGNTAHDVMQEKFGLANAEHKSALKQDEAVLLNITLTEQQRSILFSPINDMQMFWQQLAGVSTPVGNHYWQLLDINAGIPWVTSATSASFLPQELNLDYLDALSYNKGCFPGQEIIARIHYRGKAKQRLSLAGCSVDTPVQPGTRILAGETGQAIGQVINSAIHPDDGQYLLVSIKPDFVNTGQVYLQDSDEPLLILSDFQYL